MRRFSGSRTGGQEGEEMHCTENPIYVFSEMKLRSLIPNSYIHVSVSDLYIIRIEDQSAHLAAEK